MPLEIALSPYFLTSCRQQYQHGDSALRSGNNSSVILCKFQKFYYVYKSLESIQLLL